MLYRNSVTTIILILLMLLLLPITTESIEPYTVRTVYFMPTDSIDRSDWLDLDNIMKNNQEVYRSEMDRYGFPGKTFRLETDNQGQVIVHKFNGRHNKAHYSGNTMSLVIQELQGRFNDKKNIYVIVMAGMPALQQGQAGGVASTRPGGWWNKGEDHAIILSGETTIANTEQVILHELGHAFGLWHIVLYDPQEFILGSGKKLSLHEARWLSKSYYFNDVWIFGFAPTIVKFHGAENFGENNIKFRIDVSDPNGLHQAYAFLNTNIIGWDFLNGNNDTAIIDVERRHVENNTTLFIQLMDNDGNWLWYSKDFILPPAPEPENDGTFKYVTLRDPHPDSITPINNELEWVGWQNAGSFEKKPNGIAQKLPPWYIHVPKLDEWDSWIYSHAISRLVYDVSGGEYNRFDAHFYLPNPCNREADSADVKVICLADGVEIYRSEILRAPDAQNKHLQINFPNDTKKLTIQITDAGDGITCDHFVFGKAKVLIRDDEPDHNEIDEVIDDMICEDCVPDIDKEPIIEEDLGIIPQNKLTTSWATIKRRH